MIPALRYHVVVTVALVLALGIPARAQVFTPPPPNDPEHIRGEIAKVDSSSVVVKTNDGKTVSLALPDDVTIIGLTKGSFTEVELRIIDEKLRGIALGHRKWDLLPDSVIAHGWVDDMEERVMSIKYGPTEQEETDVQ